MIHAVHQVRYLRDSLNRKHEQECERLVRAHATELNALQTELKMKTDSAAQQLVQIDASRQATQQLDEFLKISKDAQVMAKNQVQKLQEDLRSCEVHVLLVCWKFWFDCATM